jgi:predicted SPOUT superfamily RNA methylase MTH1
MERQGRRIEEAFDFIVNTVPNQGTATVRTEEAVQATLALLNMFKD